MSLFYILAVIGLWLWLGRLFWRFWRRTWQQTGTRGRCIITPLFALVAIAWLSASFWYGGGRKLYYDAEVRRLCAIDGGIKVYETVKLSAERFDEYGDVRIPSRNDAKNEDDYFYEWDTATIRAGNPESGGLTTWKSTFRVVRKSDNKVLGTATNYSRRGGDFLGPWHPSSFGCPPKSDVTDLEKQLFLK